MAHENATVEELQDELRERGLPLSGNKDELRARLNETDVSDTAGGDPVLGPGAKGDPADPAAKPDEEE